LKTEGVVERPEKFSIIGWNVVQILPSSPCGIMVGVQTRGLGLESQYGKSFTGRAFRTRTAPPTKEVFRSQETHENLYGHKHAMINLV